jgi:hypothetical protein
MFVSGRDAKGNKIYVPKGRGEKQLQAALMQFCEGRSRKTVMDFLRTRNRGDLIIAIKKIQKRKKLKAKKMDFE